MKRFLITHEINYQFMMLALIILSAAGLVWLASEMALHLANSHQDLRDQSFTSLP